MASIAGTSLNDTLAGGAESDVIDGGEGNDSLSGAAGSDTISGGLGRDTLVGGEGNDVLNGGADNDFLNGGAGNDVLYGEDGNDGIYGGGGNDTIDGGAGSDNLWGDGGNDLMSGGDGADKLTGGTGNDTIDGGAGADVINGEAGNDTIIVRLGDSGDVISGGAGIDRVVLELASSQLDNALGAEFVAFQAWMTSLLDEAGGDIGVLSSATTGPTFTFTSLGLTLGTFEDIAVTVDGQAVSVASLAVTAPEVEAFTSLTTDEDEAVASEVAATDADGSVLSWSLLGAPAHGTLELDPATGHYVYTPSANYNGADQFVVRVTDDQGHTADQTVDVTVVSVNNAPLAAATASLSATEDVAASGQATATDADGDSLTWSLASGPANGTLSLDAATGAYTYVASANYSGADQFTLRVSDGRGGFADQLVSVAVAAVADAPSLATSDVSVSATKTFTGTSGNDTLTGTDGSDVINGGAGNDLLRGDGGAATYQIALAIEASLADLDGSESLSITIRGVPAAATLSAGVRNADGSWSLTAAQLAGLTLTATGAADLDLDVTAAATELSGGTASVTETLRVTFVQATGGDTIDGGAGNDTIYGGAGRNTLIDGSGNDKVYGQGGDDTFVAGTGNDTLDGGAGFDTLDMSWATSAVTVNLASGYASGGLGSDSVLNFEGIIGSSYADTLTGNSVASLISAGAGNDKVYGNGGDDTLVGGSGNDTISGGDGNDRIEDGLGNDDVSGGAGNDTFIAGSGVNKYSGGSGTDTLDYGAATQAISVNVGKGTIVGWDDDTFSSVEVFIGTSFDDRFYGGSSANTFVGGAGNDFFQGLGGADRFTGGTGNDTFFWTLKDIRGGSTRSSGGDHISDFSAGDVLDLTEFTRGLSGSALLAVLKVTDIAGGSVVAIKSGNTFYDVATLDGIHGVTVASLLADGAILV